ncbi:hypothetical protein MOMA_08251 [Moraxella macacae 0408225]|uniref:Ribosomal silencing factor RsfS n=1 Tax=Moraxella macacae 0408225 TaxID=1230338 RepID=L2F7U8_9GAMM|nr:ribosome silencing factor [Moraxella macacae]ELA08538.1 hypothetical protein MOMA_08251 [Moraxella macacae 0408225]
MNVALSPQRPSSTAPSFTNEQLKQCLAVVNTALEDLKAKNITVLDVTDLTDVMECIVIAEGTSNRHLKTVADKVALAAKQAGFIPIGTEGQGTSDWVLIDLGAVVVHVMMPQAREFYNLEGLWSKDNPH